MSSGRCTRTSVQLEGRSRPRSRTPAASMPLLRSPRRLSAVDGLVRRLLAPSRMYGPRPPAGLVPLLAFAALVAWQKPAGACSCAPRPPSWRLGEAEVAVVASVVSRPLEKDGKHAYRVRVLSSLKGSGEGAEETLVSHVSGAMCGTSFSPGASYVLFGSRGECGEIETSLCSENIPIDARHARELRSLGIERKVPPVKVVDFPASAIERCDPLLGPRNVTATAKILSLGAPDGGQMPVRLELLQVNDAGDQRGRLAAGQALAASAFFLRLEPHEQTSSSCFGPHNRPGQHVKIQLVVTRRVKNVVGCEVVSPPLLPAAAPATSAEGRARGGSCSMENRETNGARSSAFGFAVWLLLIARRRAAVLTAGWGSSAAPDEPCTARRPAHRRPSGNP